MCCSVRHDVRWKSKLPNLGRYRTLPFLLWLLLLLLLLLLLMLLLNWKQLYWQRKTVKQQPNYNQAKGHSKIKDVYSDIRQMTRILGELWQDINAWKTQRRDYTAISCYNKLNFVVDVVINSAAAVVVVIVVVAFVVVIIDVVVVVAAVVVIIIITAVVVVFKGVLTVAADTVSSIPWQTRASEESGKIGAVCVLAAVVECTVGTLVDIWTRMKRKRPSRDEVGGMDTPLERRHMKSVERQVIDISKICVYILVSEKNFNLQIQLAQKSV